MKIALSLLCGLSALASQAEDVSYLRRLRKLTSPALIWTSKNLDFTLLEDEDVTDIENVLQNLETVIEKRQKDADASPFLVIYSLDDRTTTESFAEGRDFLSDLPEFMKKGSTHLYPHCLARKKKPNTSQWAAILDSLESDLQNASEAKLVVLSDSETPGTKKNGVKYLKHAVSHHDFDKILESMGNAKVLVIEASLETYPEGGYLHHVDRLLGSTKRDVILFMAVTSPLPATAVHGLLPTKGEHEADEDESTSATLSEESIATSGSSVAGDIGGEEGTGGDEDTTSTDGSERRRRLQAKRVGEEEEVVLRIKP